MKNSTKKPIVLTDFERELLKRVRKKGFGYIARDESKNLYLYSNKPVKDSHKWESTLHYSKEGHYIYIGVFLNDLFQFVKWEDKEPYSIEELLKESDNAR